MGYSGQTRVWTGTVCCSENTSWACFEVKHRYVSWCVSLNAMVQLTKSFRIMGSIYGDVVRDCLDLGEEIALHDPASFGTDIASRLSQCVV